MKPKEFWTFVAPSVLIMSLLMVLPLFFTLYLSLQNYSFGTQPVFVGLQNYLISLQDSRLWGSLGFTLIYIAFTLPIQIILGTALALALNQMNRYSKVFITGYLIPFVVTPVVGTLIVSWLFKDRGFYTWILSLLSINVEWYAEVWAARAMIMFYGVWYTTPFVFLMVYAALQALPHEPLEASVVDGATWWQQLRFVVLPMLNPVLTFVMMVGIMDAYRMFDSVAVMTAGRPGTSTETLMYYAYSISFQQGLLGRGSAVVILTLFGILILIFPFLRSTYRDMVVKA